MKANHMLAITLCLFMVICSFVGFSPESSELEFDDRVLPTREADSDNSFDDATPLVNNSFIKASVDDQNDVWDYYKITLTGDATHGDLLYYNFTVESTLGSAYTSIYNPEKYLISEGYSNFGIPVNRTICACSFGYYYIVVRGYGTFVDYNFTVEFYNVARTTDGNNTNLTAWPAAHNGTYPGTIHSTYDYLDLFNLPVTAGSTTTEGVTVELEYWQSKKVVVFSPDGTMRDSADIWSHWNNTLPETVKFAADQTGNYRIAVSISSGFGDPVSMTSYTLKTNKTQGVPPDTDYSEELATIVYPGTKVDTEFGSEFDIYDYYMMDLDEATTLTVSVLFLDGEDNGSMELDIYRRPPYTEIDGAKHHETEGMWTTGDVGLTDRYFIQAKNTFDSHFNYSIYFALDGKNLNFWDEEVTVNATDYNFSLEEDTVDNSTLNITNMFLDPDSELIISHPSHPMGEGENIDIKILPNGTVEVTPHKDFAGYEIINFTAKDTTPITVYKHVNVTVTPVNDPSEWWKIERINPSGADIDIVYGEDTVIRVNEDVEYHFTIVATDVDGDDLLYNCNVSNKKRFSFDEQGNITFSPIQEDVGSNRDFSLFFMEFEVYDNSSPVIPINKTKVIFNITNVNDAPGPPTISYSITDADVLQEGNNNLSVNFSVSRPTDEDGETSFKYKFNFDNSGQYEIFTDYTDAETVYYEYTYDEPGFYVANVTVVDKGDLTNWAVTEEINVTDIVIPVVEPKRWSAGFRSGDKDDEVLDTIEIEITSSMYTSKTEIDYPEEGKATTILEYDVSGTCGSDVKMIHLYYKIEPTSEVYVMVLDPNDFTPAAIEPGDEVTWNYKVKNENTIPMPEAMVIGDDDVATDDDTEEPPKLRVWYAAVAWTDDGFNIHEKESLTDFGEQITTDDDDDDDDDDGGSGLLIAVVIGLILFFVIAIVIVVVVVLIVVKGKKKEEEAPPGQMPPPEGDAAPGGPPPGPPDPQMQQQQPGFDPYGQQQTGFDPYGQDQPGYDQQQPAYGQQQQTGYDPYSQQVSGYEQYQMSAYDQDQQLSGYEQYPQSGYEQHSQSGYEQYQQPGWDTGPANMFAADGTTDPIGSLIEGDHPDAPYFAESMPIDDLPEESQEPMN